MQKCGHDYSAFVLYLSDIRHMVPSGQVAEVDIGLMQMDRIEFFWGLLGSAGITGCLACAACLRFMVRSKRPPNGIAIFSMLVGGSCVVAVMAYSGQLATWLDESPALIALICPLAVLALVTPLVVVGVYQHRFDRVHLEHQAPRREYSYRRSWRKRRWAHLVLSSWAVAISTIYFIMPFSIPGHPGSGFVAPDYSGPPGEPTVGKPVTPRRPIEQEKRRLEPIINEQTGWSVPFSGLALVLSSGWLAFTLTRWSDRPLKKWLAHAPP